MSLALAPSRCQQALRKRLEGHRCQLERISASRVPLIAVSQIRSRDRDACSRSITEEHSVAEAFDRRRNKAKWPLVTSSNRFSFRNRDAYANSPVLRPLAHSSSPALCLIGTDSGRAALSFCGQFEETYSALHRRKGKPARIRQNPSPVIWKEYHLDLCGSRNRSHIKRLTIPPEHFAQGFERRILF